MSRRSVLIAIGATLALTLMWFVFLWGPQGGRLEDAKNRATAADDQNAQLELRLSRLRDAETRAAALTADVETLRRAVPDTPDLAELILDANQAASDTDVDFLSISPGVPQPGEGSLPPVIPLSITVTGRYFAVLDYLDRLTSLPRVVVIDSIGVVPSGSGAGTNPDDLSVDLTGRMFSATAPQLAPAPELTPDPDATSSTTTPAAAQVTTSVPAPDGLTTAAGARP